MNKKLVTTIVIIVLVLGAAYWYKNNMMKPSLAPGDDNVGINIDVEGGEGENTAAGVNMEIKELGESAGVNINIETPEEGEETQ